MTKATDGLQPARISLSDVVRFCALPERDIRKEIAKGEFPRPHMVAGKEAWIKGELIEWAYSRPVVVRDARVEGPTELYRHFDGAGTLLYVGVSLSTTVRLMAHMDRASWADAVTTITIERFPTRAAAQDAERAAIKAEGPLHNIAHARKP